MDFTVDSPVKSDSTSFLNLTAELRKRIYTMITEDQDFDPVISFRATKHPGQEDDINIRPTKRAGDVPQPIARVNKQIRAESLGLLFSTTMVILQVNEEALFDVGREWIQLMPEEALAAIINYSFSDMPERLTCNCALRDQVTVGSGPFGVGMDLHEDAEVNVQMQLGYCVCRVVGKIYKRVLQVTEALGTSGRSKSGKPVATKKFLLQALNITGARNEFWGGWYAMNHRD